MICGPMWPVKDSTEKGDHWISALQSSFWTNQDFYEVGIKILSEQGTEIKWFVVFGLLDCFR